jgi:glycosyltransferase involved in cell wall biosynthesis
MSRRLRVAVVAPSLAILGGQSVQAHQLLAGWAGDADVEAWLVPINPVPPRPIRPLVRVKYLRTLATQAAYWPLLVSELRRADVVHVFSASYTSFLLSPLPAMLVGRWLNRPVLLNYHSGEAPDHLRRSSVARAALAAVDRIVVPSRFLSEVFATFGLDAEIIPNVVDRSRFAFRLRDPLRPRFISTRNLEPMYNVGCTIRAFGLVQQRYPDATLTIVGAGSQEGALDEETARLGIRGVRFVGRVPPDAIAALYSDADIYLQSPDIDNMPLSVLEAFASGLPVVSTRAGGVPALVADGVNGLLVPMNDERALAGCALRLLEEPGLARSLSIAAHSATDAYDWNSVRAAWLSAYRGLSRNAAPATSAVHPA